MLDEEWSSARATVQMLWVASVGDRATIADVAGVLI
jgi:hypothetical protein